MVDPWVNMVDPWVNMNSLQNQPGAPLTVIQRWPESTQCLQYIQLVYIFPYKRD